MKIFFSFAIVMAAVAMVSCGGNATKPAEAVEVEATEVVTETPDSTACAQCDSTACDKAVEECPSK